MSFAFIVANICTARVKSLHRIIVGVFLARKCLAISKVLRNIQNYSLLRFIVIFITSLLYVAYAKFEFYRNFKQVTFFGFCFQKMSKQGNNDQKTYNFVRVSMLHDALSQAGEARAQKSAQVDFLLPLFHCGYHKSQNRY